MIAPRSILLHLMFGLALAAGLSLLVVTPALAHDCLADPLNAADCMRTPGAKETITVIFTVLPTISVLVPNLVQPGTRPGQPGVVQQPGPQQPPGPDQPPDEQADKPQEVRYVVQASHQQVRLKPGESQGLSFKAYKSVDNGPWQPAPEVQLRLTLSPGSAEIRLSPQNAGGEMQSSLEIGEKAEPGEYQIEIHGSSPRAQTSATIQLTIEPLDHDIRTSTQRLEIIVGETLELVVTPESKTEAGTMEKDDKARLRPWLPSEKGFFSWEPPGPYGKGENELYGEVVFKITALKSEQPEELFFLDFTAIFEDDDEVDKRVEIVLKAADFVIEFL